MVSIREVERQRQQQSRIDRLVSARRQATDLGVASARHYQEAKKDQDRAVHEDIRRKLVEEAAARSGRLAAQVKQAEQKRGQGMRAAQQLVVARGEQAELELGAWDAERRLDAMRHELAVDRMHAEQRRLNAPRLEAAERWEKVHQVEQQRAAKARLALDQQQHSLSAARTAPTSTSNARRLTNIEVNVISRPFDDGECAAQSAAAHHEARTNSLQLREQRVKSLRSAAQKRACEAVMQHRHNELLRQQEAAKAAQLQKELVAASMKRAGRPGYAEFQEEEARRVQRINHQAHLVFEKTFLATDGWEVNALRQSNSKRVGIATEADDTELLFSDFQNDEAAAEMLTCAFGLPARVLHPHEFRYANPNEDPSLSDDSEAEGEPREL